MTDVQNNPIDMDELIERVFAHKDLAVAERQTATAAVRATLRAQHLHLWRCT